MSPPSAGQVGWQSPFGPDLGRCLAKRLVEGCHEVAGVMVPDKRRWKEVLVTQGRAVVGALDMKARAMDRQVPCLGSTDALGCADHGAVMEGASQHSGVLGSNV